MFGKFVIKYWAEGDAQIDTMCDADNWRCVDTSSEDSDDVRDSDSTSSDASFGEKYNDTADTQTQHRGKKRSH